MDGDPGWQWGSVPDLVEVAFTLRRDPATKQGEHPLTML